MGTNMQWVAIENGDVKAICGAFKLRQIPYADAMNSGDNAIFFGLHLSNGWYILNSFAYNFPEESALEELSSKHGVITGAVMETTMMSSLSMWQEGKEIWSIVHDLSNGVYDLELKGNLPEQFQEIRDRLVAKQAAQDKERESNQERLFGCDYIFSVPVELGETLTGFNYCKSHGCIEDCYVPEDWNKTCYDSSWFTNKLEERLKSLGLFPDRLYQSYYVFGGPEGDAALLNCSTIGANPIHFDIQLIFQSTEIADLFASLQKELDFRLPSSDLNLIMTNLDIQYELFRVLRRDSQQDVERAIEFIYRDLKENLMPLFSRYQNLALSESDVQYLSKVHSAHYLLPAILKLAKEEKRARELAERFSKVISDKNYQEFLNLLFKDKAL